MSVLTKTTLPLRTRGGGATSTILSQYGRSPAYRRISFLQNSVGRRPPTYACRITTTPASQTPLSLRSTILADDHLSRIASLAARHFHQNPPLFQQTKPDDEVKDPPRSGEAAGDTSSDSARSSSGESGSSSESSSESSSGKSDQDGQSEDEGKEESKEETKKKEAPPPPHGGKSPLQVFMDTLRSEFKESKEWNEGTKQLASGYNEFTQNPNLKKARSAYSTGADAVTSTTGKALRGTGRVVGQSAAWTWDTLPVKAMRTTANATGRGMEKITRPLRETETFKSMSDVVDDGSSSRYGGWAEKEQRRKRREAREMQDATSSGRPVRRAEKIEEDPEAGTNITVHKDAAWKESWRSFRDQSRVFQGLNTMKSTYAESENPLISTARSVTDRIAGFFAENETAMVIKKFREIDPSFQLEPFLQDMREYILPEVLDAYVKGDVEVLRAWLSAAQYQVYEALMRQYTTNGLKSDGRILDIRNVDVLSARLLDPGEIPVFILTCRTQEVHVYRNAKSGELAAGMEDRVQQVTYAIGVTRIPEDVSNQETRGWRLIELQKSARDYM